MRGDGKAQHVLTRLNVSHQEKPDAVREYTEALRGACQCQASEHTGSREGEHKAGKN